MTGTSRTLAVLGTIVHDRIVPVDGAPVERWGGIGYAAAAAAATMPAGWTVRLLTKVGEDLAGPAQRLLDALPRTEARLHVVPEPTNRVELRYTDADRRTEHLTGGVPGWTPDELGPALDGCDALLVNYVAGWETDLDTAGVLRSLVPGPVWADLHSLFLDRSLDGVRRPRPLPLWKRWIGAFDAVQMNEDELGLLGGEDAAGLSLDEVRTEGPSVVAVTRGPRGSSVAWDARAGWPAGAAREGTRTGERDVTLGTPRAGDPTGCGDIWGAVMFGRLLAGAGVTEAAGIANRVAAASLDHQGVEGLVDRLGDVTLEGGPGSYFESRTEVER